MSLRELWQVIVEWPYAGVVLKWTGLVVGSAVVLGAVRELITGVIDDVRGRKMDKHI